MLLTACSGFGHESQPLPEAASLEGVDQLSADAIEAIRDDTFSPVAKLVERMYEASPRGFVLAPNVVLEGYVNLTYSEQLKLLMW
jgi:hypothetical protein